MPDIFDQLDEQKTAAPAEPQGDIFDQLDAQPQGNARKAAADYMAQHNILDPQQVQATFTAFENLFSGNTGPAHLTSPQEIAQQGADQRGFLANMGGGIGRTLARGTEGAVGLISPETGKNLRENNDLVYAHGGKGGTTGEFIGGAVNAPLALNPVGRVLSAAEAAGNSRITTNQARAGGADIGVADEIANAAGSGALDYVANKAAAGLLGKTVGSMSKALVPNLIKAAATGETAAVTKEILKQFAMKFGAEVIGNDLIGRAHTLAQNVVNKVTTNPNQAIGEGQGIENEVNAFLQTAVFSAVAAPGEIRKAKAFAQAGSTPTASGVDPTTVQPATPGPEAPAPVAPIDAPVAKPVERRFTSQDMLDYINVKSTDADMEGARQLLGDKEYVKQQVPIESLKTRGSTEAKKADIERYANQPSESAPAVVADESGTIIDGNRRLEAARLRGDKTVEAYVPVPPEPAAPAEAPSRSRAEDQARLDQMTAQATQMHTEDQARIEKNKTLLAPAPAPANAPTPSEKVRTVANDYNKSVGLPPQHDTAYAPVDPARGKKIADWFQTAEHQPNDPKVKASYDALKNETKAQWDAMQKAGIKAEPWTEKGQPYANSKEMMADVAKGHLWFFTGGEMPADHPLAAKLPGTDLPYNDVFRAVHDYFGHAKEGVGFGPRGEENAWRQHVQMFTPEAQPAMTAETRGQNSWVNFGPEGEGNQAKPGATKFAEQKATLPPDWVVKEGGVQPPKTQSPAQAGQAARTSIQQAAASGRGPNWPMNEPGVSFGGTPHERAVPGIVERIITPVISRIHDLAPAVSRRVRDMYLAIGTKSTAWKNDVRPGFTEIEKYRNTLTPAEKVQLNDALFNDQKGDLKDKLPENLHPALDAFFEARSQAFDQQKAAGVTLGDIGDRFPRRVIDPKGLKAHLGSDAGVFDEAMKVRTQAKGSPLTVDEMAEVYSDVINGYGPKVPGSVGPAHARFRSVEKVTPEMQKFYADPLESGIGYFDAAAKAVERAKFLGRGDDPALLNDSVGKVIAEQANNLPPEKQHELHGLLQTLFLADTKHTSRPVQTIRQAIYATSLAHAWSGINQLTDVAMQAARYNMKSARGGLADALHLTPASERYLLHDMGMDHPGQEFGDAGKFSHIAEKGLVANLFKRIDVLTKESGLNTARRYMTEAAANPEGAAFAKVKREWEPVYGPEDFADAMNALKRGDLHNENARSLAFAHLTQMQPVTMANMPENYLKMSDGRLLYTLHTFQLQSLDMLRRDIARKIRTPGQRAEGLHALGRTILMAGLAGMSKDFVKDFMTGQLSTKSFGDRGADALLGIAGLNRYVATDFSKHPVKTMMDMALPPVSQFDAPAQDVATIVGGKVGEKGLQSFKLIPVPYINDLMYYWTPWGAGWHKSEKDAKADYNDKLKQLLTDAQKAGKSGDHGQAQSMMELYRNLQREHGAKK